MPQWSTASNAVLFSMCAEHCVRGGRAVRVGKTEVLKERCWQSSLRERVSKIAEELCEDKDKLQKQLDETRQELQRVRASQTHSSTGSSQAWEQEKAALTERIRELEARCSSVTQVFESCSPAPVCASLGRECSQVRLRCDRARAYLARVWGQAVGMCVSRSASSWCPSRLWTHQDCALWCRHPPPADV